MINANQNFWYKIQFGATIFRLMGKEVPAYVSSNVTDNRRNYTTNFQQRSSAVFTATYDVEGTYNAYEKDIAVVSFFFEYPTVFEFTRQVLGK